MGRTGNALVMLLPHESAYVEFLELRKVPLVEVAPSPSLQAAATTSAAGGGMGNSEKDGSEHLLDLLRREAEADREVRKECNQKARDTLYAMSSYHSLLSLSRCPS